jgi:pimeloyl-CoA dehydrogenase large subunit
VELSLSREDAAFRDEVRAFIAENYPQEMRVPNPETDLTKEQMLLWHRILYNKGWIAPLWPKEYGGPGWSITQRFVFEQETSRAGTLPPLAFSVTMVGPVIYTFGNDAQKQKFLPRILSGEDWWCQGYSEPGSGSDLASVRTKAVRDGDHYIVNGHKTWTTLAQHADWIFCLVRTNPTAKPQAGISFLLIDMKSPGITVRPIETLDGGHEVNEVFFDDVKVPVENLVGQENKGWDYAKFLLGNERTNIARVGVSKERLRRIRELASIERIGDEPMIRNPRFREKLAAAEIELKALEMTQLRVVAAERTREKGKPDPASSVLKIKGSEIQQMTTELLMDVVGPYALPYVPEREDDRWNEPAIGPDYAATVAPTYFNWRKVSIYGGSNEIQRNIIAKAILGL